MMRFAALGAAAALFLAGCVSTRLPENTFKQAVRQCETDASPRWLVSPERIESLLLVGEVQDPSLTDGKIVPIAPFSNAIDANVVQYMERLDLRRVDVVLRPRSVADHRFGPVAPQREGVYAVERWPRGDARCLDYERAVRDLEYPGRSAEFRDYIAPREDECLGYRYVGEIDLAAHSHFISFHHDGNAARLGYYRASYELRDRSSNAVARSVVYVIDTSRLPTCVKVRPIPDLLSVLSH